MSSYDQTLQQIDDGGIVILERGGAAYAALLPIQVYYALVKAQSSALCSSLDATPSFLPLDSPVLQHPECLNPEQS